MSKTSLKKDSSTSAADASAALVELARLLGRAAARAELREAAEVSIDTTQPPPVPASRKNLEEQENAI